MSIHHDQEPFDLDRMCAEARERLRAEIDHSALKTHYEWAKACHERVFRDAFRIQLEKSLGVLRLDMLFTSPEQAGAFVEYKPLERK